MTPFVSFTRVTHGRGNRTARYVRPSAPTVGVWWGQGSSPVTWGFVPDVVPTCLPRSRKVVSLFRCGSVGTQGVQGLRTLVELRRRKSPETAGLEVLLTQGWIVRHASPNPVHEREERDTCDMVRVLSDTHDGVLGHRLVAHCSETVPWKPNVSGQCVCSTPFYCSDTETWSRLGSPVSCTRGSPDVCRSWFRSDWHCPGSHTVTLRGHTQECSNKMPNWVSHGHSKGMSTTKISRSSLRPVLGVCGRRLTGLGTDTTP